MERLQPPRHVRADVSRQQLGIALDMIEAAERAGIALRLIGGLAVACHSPTMAGLDELRREYVDIDFVASAGGRGLDEALGIAGYVPDARFNSLHGRTRRLYFEGSGANQIDVFIREFAMCHKIPLEARLHVEKHTIPLAELFLTKAQIVQLNHKDLLDLVVLLTEHPVERGDNETINADRVAELVGADWGLWRTVTGTLATLEAQLNKRAELAAHRGLVGERLAELRALLAAAPKSRRWRLRARMGDRVQWYELPEDPRRSQSASTAPSL